MLSARVAYEPSCWIICAGWICCPLTFSSPGSLRCEATCLSCSLSLHLGNKESSWPATCQACKVSCVARTSLTCAAILFWQVPD